MNKLEKCEKALTKLKDFLSTETDVNPQIKEVVRAGVIQAFEYTYEVFWQYFQSVGKNLGLTNISAPRHAFVFAYAEGLIENSEIWIKLMRSRNNTSHTYNESVAEEIFKEIRDVYRYEFEKALLKIKEKNYKFNEI